MINITILKWYDTITPASASEGEYSETGCDMSHIYCDSLSETVEEFVNLFKENCWDCFETLAVTDQVLYAVDPDKDYHTGEEAYDRLCLSVGSDYDPDISADDSIKQQNRIHRIKRALNYLISKKI